ncbi:hypothetical protein [Deinococcus fonticola]|uniref:hypothetical protein n=1 Tax=Deinococcus fonticola TaxID=2528713 RepID=UPI0010752336|nr:hypothetical protein [Deinococcus fonticola]
MTKPDLVPADLPTLPTAQMLARLSAEPGRCQMTVDSASPWVAGVIVRTPRLYLALHAVNTEEAQIIAAPRVAGLAGSGDAQLQALLANAAPQDDGLYRDVPPPAPGEAAPPPLEPVPGLTTAGGAAPARRIDYPLVLLWFAFALFAFGSSVSLLNLIAALMLVAAAVSALLGVPRGNGLPTASPLRTASLVTAGLGILTLLFAAPFTAGPLVLLLALVSIGTALAPRLAGRSSTATMAPAAQQSDSAEVSASQALPAPQLQLIETTRTRLIEHLEVAERSGNPRDVFEAKQALEVHLPEVVERWEALPTWRRRDDAPLRRTLEGLATVSVPDTTTSELEWDATERFIEQKARAKASESGELGVRREPLTPPARTPDMPRRGTDQDDKS